MHFHKGKAYSSSISSWLQSSKPQISSSLLTLGGFNHSIISLLVGFLSPSTHFHPGHAFVQFLCAFWDACLRQELPSFCHRRFPRMSKQAPSHVWEQTA